MKLFEKAQAARQQIQALEGHAMSVRAHILGVKPPVDQALINSDSMSDDLDAILESINLISSVLDDLASEVVRPNGQ